MSVIRMNALTKAQSVTSSDLDRFFRRVVFASTGCWLWTGDRNNNGYGRFSFKGKVLAHRFAWCLVNGVIPANYESDHRCCVRSCVNPDHLEIVTHQENIRRRANNGVAVCQRGHRYTPETTYIHPRGSRECKSCRRLLRKRYSLRMKGVA